MKRSDAMWVGGAVGALFGAAVAYLLSPRPEPRDEVQKGPSVLARVEPGDAVAIGKLLWSLFRRIQGVLGREAPLR